MKRMLTRFEGPSAVLVCILAACGTDGTEHVAVAAKSTKLPEGVVAMVGNEAVDARLVGRIAAKQGRAVREARDLAITDALLALHAAHSARGSDLVAVAERSALARALLERIEAKAEGGGPPTDEEIERTTREQWLDFDRPVSVRTVHFVAMVKEDADEAPARSLAERVAAAAEGATDEKGFRKAAEGVPAGTVQTRVEALPPVCPDGRVADLEQRPPPGTPTPTFDPEFARAANAIREVGEKSPPIRSEYGWHVILLLERIPEKRVAFEERRRVLAKQIVAQRAADRLDRVLAKQKAISKVEVVRSADDLTERVRVR